MRRESNACYALRCSLGRMGCDTTSRENTIHKLYTELQAGRKHGMITMDRALLDFYQRGDLNYDTALTAARDPEAIRKRTA